MQDYMQDTHALEGEWVRIEWADKKNEVENIEAELKERARRSPFRI